MRCNAPRRCSPKPDRREELIPVSAARRLLGEGGRPVARQTVFALAARGEIDVRCIAGRFVVTGDSIRAYRARRGDDVPSRDAP